MDTWVSALIVYSMVRLFSIDCSFKNQLFFVDVFHESHEAAIFTRWSSARFDNICSFGIFTCEIINCSARLFILVQLLKLSSHLFAKMEFVSRIAQIEQFCTGLLGWWTVWKNERKFQKKRNQNNFSPCIALGKLLRYAVHCEYFGIVGELVARVAYWRTNAQSNLNPDHVRYSEIEISRELSTYGCQIVFASAHHVISSPVFRI